MDTIEQEIEALARIRWPAAGRIDVGSAMSHVWHGDVEPSGIGFSILISTKTGGLIKRLQADSLEKLKAKVRANSDA